MNCLKTVPMKAVRLELDTEVTLRTLEVKTTFFQNRLFRFLWKGHKSGNMPKGFL